MKLPLRLLAITPPRGPVDPACIDAWRRGLLQPRTVTERHGEVRGGHDLPAADGQRSATPIGLALLLREPGLAPVDLLDSPRLAGVIARARATAIPLLLSADTAVMRSATADLFATLRDRCDGLHLRGDPSQSATAQVRARWPSPKWLGRSVHGPPVADPVVDYSVLAPVFTPRTDPAGKTPAGLDAVRAWARVAPPVLALGGITPPRSAGCLAAGAYGLAGIRVFFGPADEVADNVGVLAANLRRVMPPP